MAAARRRAAAAADVDCGVRAVEAADDGEELELRDCGPVPGESPLEFTFNEPAPYIFAAAETEPAAELAGGGDAMEWAPLGERLGIGPLPAAAT